MWASGTVQAPRTLGLGASLLRPAHLWGLMLTALGVPVLVLVGLLFALERRVAERAGTGRVLETLWAELLQDPGNRLLLWALAVLAPLAAVFLLAQRAAHIRVTSMGLQGHVPRWLGVGVFRQTAGRWDIRWEAVRRVRLVEPAPLHNPVQRLGRYRLVIETDRGETWLNPFAWFDRVGRDHRLGLGELLTFRRLDPARRVQSAPLIGAVRARGFDIEHDTHGGRAHARGFDLARHPGMVGQLALLFGTGLYALADTFFLAAYVPLEWMPAWPFVVTGVAAVLAVSALGRGAPRTERVVVGALVAGALIAAVYPATLRVNAATAEPETATYVAVGPGRFQARDAGLPAIDLTGAEVDEYWTQYPPGREHEFTLLHGIGGFHQLDLSPLHERTRRFYSRDAPDI